MTQATVSRDIKELKLTKAPDASGLYCYVLPNAPEDASGRHMTILSRSVDHVDFAKNMVVIKTHSGMAQAAAAVLDGLAMEEIVGTLAGDDTIFCVTRDDGGSRDDDAAMQLTERIKALL